MYRAQDLDSLFSGSSSSSSMSFDTPLITLVLLLVRHRLPSSPTPALDYAWESKGARATKEDMDVYWEHVRKTGGAKSGGLKAGGAEGGESGLGPSPLPKRSVQCVLAVLAPVQTVALGSGRTGLS